MHHKSLCALITDLSFRIGSRGLGGGHPRSLSWWSAIEEPYDFHISLGEVKIILGGVICIGTSTYHISLGEVKVIHLYRNFNLPYFSWGGEGNPGLRVACPCCSNQYVGTKNPWYTGFSPGGNFDQELNDQN